MSIEGYEVPFDGAVPQEIPDTLEHTELSEQTPEQKADTAQFKYCQGKSDEYHRRLTELQSRIPLLGTAEYAAFAREERDIVDLMHSNDRVINELTKRIAKTGAAFF